MRETVRVSVAVALDTRSHLPREPHGSRRASTCLSHPIDCAQLRPPRLARVRRTTLTAFRFSLRAVSSAVSSVTASKAPASAALCSAPASATSTTSSAGPSSTSCWPTPHVKGGPRRSFVSLPVSEAAKFPLGMRLAEASAWFENPRVGGSIPSPDTVNLAETGVEAALLTPGSTGSTHSVVGERRNLLRR